MATLYHIIYIAALGDPISDDEATVKTVESAERPPKKSERILQKSLTESFEQLSAAPPFTLVLFSLLNYFHLHHFVLSPFLQNSLPIMPSLYTTLYSGARR